MRIIKQGVKPPAEVEHTCIRCSTVFAYTKEDVKEDFRDGDYVLCPSCGSSILAKSFSIPFPKKINKP